LLWGEPGERLVFSLLRVAQQPSLGGVAQLPRSAAKAEMTWQPLWPD